MLSRGFSLLVVTSLSRQLNVKTRPEIGNIYTRRVLFTLLRCRVYKLSLSCFNDIQLRPLIFRQHIRALTKDVSWHTFCGTIAKVAASSHLSLKK